MFTKENVTVGCTLIRRSTRKAYIVVDIEALYVRPRFRQYVTITFANGDRKRTERLSMKDILRQFRPEGYVVKGGPPLNATEPEVKKQSEPEKPIVVLAKPPKAPYNIHPLTGTIGRF